MNIYCNGKLKMILQCVHLFICVIYSFKRLKDEKRFVLKKKFLRAIGIRFVAVEISAINFTVVDGEDKNVTSYLQ